MSVYLLHFDRPYRHVVVGRSRLCAAFGITSMARVRGFSPWCVTRASVGRLRGSGAGAPDISSGG